MQANQDYRVPVIIGVPEGAHLADLFEISSTAMKIESVVGREALLERQGDPATHDAYGVGRIDKRLSARLPKRSPCMYLIMTPPLYWSRERLSSGWMGIGACEYTQG